MTQLTVLAFDPGGTTGWAAYRATKIVDPDGIAEYYADEAFGKQGFQFGTLGPEKHHMKLVTLMELMRTDIYHVVTESFEFRQGKQRVGLELISRDYIGIMDLWTQQNDQRLTKQTASLGKGFVSDKKLKIMDLWSQSKHSRDASRHLVYFLVNRLGIHYLIEPWKGL